MQYSAPIVRISTPVDASKEAVGTGFCIQNNTGTDDIIFLTNAHVVAPGAKHFIEVVWAPGHPIPIEVSAIVYDRDIALLACSKELWEKMANTYLSGYELEHILSVPTLELGNDTMFSASGTPLLCKGHPLGLPEQQVSYGNTRGVINMPNGEQRNLIQNPINHGNSGGPVLVNHEGKEYVVGISTMKLSGKDVEGEGGMININEIRAVLPSLLSTLKPPSIQVNPAMLQKLSAMFGRAFPEAVVAGLEPKKSSWLAENGQKLMSEWESYAVGGRVGGEPRSFSAWIMRHVVDSEGQFMYNGKELLHYVLEQCMMNNYDDLAELKSCQGGWKSIRLGSNNQSVNVMRMLNKYSQKEPVLLHAPILGWSNTQSVHNVDYKEYYKTDKDGMIINTVFPNSLYAKNGGEEGDLVYAFQKNNDEKVYLDKEGRFSKSGALGMRLSVATMCHHVQWDIGQENPTKIKLFAVKRGGEEKTVEFTMRPPTENELPNMHMITPFNNESKHQNAAVLEGFQLAQMHMNHVQQMGLSEYADPVRQYDFRIMCMAYPIGGVKVAPGSVLVSMNGWDGEKEVNVQANSWKSWSDFEAHIKSFEMGIKTGKIKHWKAVFGRPGFKVSVIKKL